MTREEYYRLGDAGFFGDERVELLGGEVWRLPPQSPQHFTTGEAVTDTLLSAFGKGFDARRQGPLCLGNDSEPEPDVVIVPGTWRDYVEQHPTPSKVRLLVEVSDATLRKDRTTKAQDYAQAGIADYWIVNLVHRQLEVFRDPLTRPEGALYRTTLSLLPGDSLAPLSAPVAIADLLPAVLPSS